MSLIPSESHSFPDNYSPVARSRRSKKCELSPPRPSEKPVERNVASLAATEETKVISPAPAQPVDEQFFQAVIKIAGSSNVAPPATEQSPEASAPAVPTPGADEQFFQALIRMAGSNIVLPEGEPSPKTILPAPIKRPPRASIAQPLSAADVDEASMLIANGHGRASQYRPRTPVRVAQSRPVKNATNGQPGVESPVMSSSFVEQPNNDFDFTELVADIRRRVRRTKKFTRFILIEVFALAILIPSAWLVLSRHVTNPPLVIMLNILTIAAGATMAIVPIIWYAIAPVFSRPR